MFSSRAIFIKRLSNNLSPTPVIIMTIARNPLLFLKVACSNENSIDRVLPCLTDGGVLSRNSE